VMDPQNFKRVEELYHAALEQPLGERESFVSRACDGDQDLLREVRSLLGHESEARRLIEEPAVAAATQEAWPETARPWVGRRVGGYEILAPLGAGGMGEVYRAKDTTLGREVALKVLPEAFSRDLERVARFQREARLLAALNHPNIASIHGLEESNGHHYLVLELVPGESLAEKAARGPLPLDELLPIFRQMAVALEAAHEKGIVHRDLKPANVAVTPEGEAKLLDFGLAKAFSAEPAAADPDDSPTLSEAGTREGLILGTASYMSPEQARGRALDERTDIWSFGCCLFEALIGRRVFRGKTVSDTLAAVLERDVDWESLPETTPEPIRRLLRRCLQKDRNQRLRHIADARWEIEDALDGPSGAVRAPSVSRAPVARRPRWQLALGAVVLAGAASLVTWASLRTSPTLRPEVTRFTIDIAREVGAGAQLLPFGTPLAVAPDGSRLAYLARGREGPPRVYVRELDQFGSRPLPEADGSDSLFFSPDGRTLGFGGPDLTSVWRVPAAGGPSSELGRTERFQGAFWGSDGRIVANAGGGIWVLSASGGGEELLPSLKGTEVHQILPGGELLISDRMSPGDTIAIVSLESDKRRSLVRAQTGWARLLPTGRLIWATGGALLGVRLAPGGGGPVGDPVVVLDGVQGQALSDNGTLVYAPSPGRGDDEIVWVDGAGRATPVPGTPRGRVYGPRLSPDGRRAAFVIEDGPATWDIWVLDLDRGTRRRLTFNGQSGWPVWSPDGAWIACRQGANAEESQIVRLPADGSGEATLIAPLTASPTTWSPDGRTLAATDFGRQTIWIVSIEGETSELPAGPGRKGISSFSPDGRWLAYSSRESGREEVYVRPFPGPGFVTVVSRGGKDPFWSPGGDELFYYSPDSSPDSSTFFAVDVELSEDSVQVGTPRRLFEGNYWGFDVSQDGRILMSRVYRPPPITELRVVLNWTQELEQLVH
jgi:Tol biopolymer transport system component